jgi:hypothetical protein
MTWMTADELRDFLNERGANFGEQEISYGGKFQCETGEIFVAYDTGKVVCQGKATGLAKTVKDWKRPAEATAQVKPKQAVAAVATGPSKRVFIVYEAAGYKPDTKGL